MSTNPSPAVLEPVSTTRATSQVPEVLHSFQDLPVSVGQVSAGPFGAVARKDHRSWQTKGMNDPAYWSGRIDSAVGEWIRDRPIPRVAVCVGIGALAGWLYGRSPRAMRR